MISLLPFLRWTMRLEGTQEAQRWLLQFEPADREVARQLLRRLTLVSQSEFEMHLQLALAGVLSRVGGENIALVTVDEPPPTTFTVGKQRRVPGSSSDRIKHLIENFARVQGNRVRANPTVGSMRADRIRNLVLVEDFIGSGDRVRSFWKDQVSSSVKSWVSFGWTRVWIVSYAALKHGISAVRRDVPVEAEDVVTVLPSSDRRVALSETMNFVAEKYGRKLRGDMWPGYSQGGGALVFQHGCPNNTPAILWAAGKGFRPIFPDRGVPPSIQGCFGMANSFQLAETLWNFRQYRMGLSLLDESKSAIGDTKLRLVVALGLASAHGKWEDSKLQKQLMLPKKAVMVLRELAVQLDLISSPTGTITKFGFDLIARMKSVRSGRKSLSTPPAKKLPSVAELYYPDTCEGVARR